MASETIRAHALGRGGLCAVGVMAAVVATAAPPPTPAAAQTPRVTKSSAGEVSPSDLPAIDSASVAIVRRMGEFLRTVQAFRLQVESSTDEVLLAGPKIQYNRSADIVIRRPDRMRVNVLGDDADRQYFYDGKSLTLFGRRLNYYATVPAPGTLDSLFDVLVHRYDLVLPVVDVLYASAHDVLLKDVSAGMLLGTGIVAGTECDHLAFHQKGLDWQLWVERGDRPVPRKLVLTTLDEPSQPQHAAVLTWNLSPTIDETIFAFTPPADAGRIIIAETGRGTSSGKPK